MKKYIWKRMLILTLALVLVAGVLPVEALAADDLTDSVTGVTLKDADNDGYYDIGTEDELFAFANLVNAGSVTINGELTAGITMTGSAKPWTPIGITNQYKGAFNGNHFAISNLYCNRSGDFVGFVGNGYQATIQNLTISNSTIIGTKYVGAIVGNPDSCTITNCHNIGTPVSGLGFVGGIVGSCSGTVSYCTNSGSVSADEQYAGGIVGFGNCAISNCTNSGNVFCGSSSGGGIAGYYQKSTISNCFSTGVISGNGSLGGVVGYCSSNGTVTNCYYDNTVYTGGGINGGSKDMGRSTDAFKSGEVAWLLNGDQSSIIWGQTIGTNNYPTLGGQRVYRTITYSDCRKIYVTGIQYSNTSATGADVEIMGEHSLSYAAGATGVITEFCANCTHSAKATITLKAGQTDTPTYTASAHEPYEVTYSETWQGTKDLTVSYENNINAGTATASITVAGQTATKTFTIAPKALEQGMATLNPTSGTYNNSGNPAPTITLIYNGEALAMDTDYTVGNWTGDFSTVGEKTVTVSGKGNFSGDISLTYSIGKGTPTGSLFQLQLPLNAIYDGTTAFSATVTPNAPGMGAITVKYNGSTEAPVIAGTYTVTVDVAEGTNYNAATGIELGGFTVAKAEGSASVSVVNWEYGDTASTPVPVSATNGTGSVTYLYKVKGAEDESYTATVPTAVGEYTVKATFAATANYQEAVATADFAIVKRKVTVRAMDASTVYGENPSDFGWSVISGSQLESEKLSLKTSAGMIMDAGEYTIIVSQDEGANPNYDITFVNGTLTVTKAPLTVTAEAKTIRYGDAAPAYTVTFSGFKYVDSPSMLGGTLALTCDYDQFDDKGTYTITPGGYTSDNYDITFVPGTLTVDPKAITVTIDNKTSIYGNNVVELTADDNGGIVNNDTNVYSLATTASNTAAVGTYAITGAALDENYDITFANEADAYTITPRELTVTVTVADKAYDGLNIAAITSAELCNKANGDAVTLVNGTPTFDSVEVGNDISISFTDFTLSGDADILKNYTLTQPTGITASITNTWTPAAGVEYTMPVPNSNGWLNEGFNIVPASGYLLSPTNSDSGMWLPQIPVSAEGKDMAVTIHVRNKADNTISLPVMVNYSLDLTNPTGKVEFVERKAWQEFVNAITFGLFYKEEVTVKATAADALSGVDAVEYAAADKAMTLDEVKAITDWKAMPEAGVAVTLEDARKFVYFVRITDKAGNVTYLSTDGAVYDTTAPVVSGVENGAIYYTTQKVTVTETNLESVTLNGEDATESITLEGNKEATYTIKVTDKAGNVTTVSVTMKPIAVVEASVAGISEDNVKSSDEDKLQSVIDHVDALLSDADVTAAEETELEKIKKDAEALIDRIEAIADAQETVRDDAAAYDPDSVNSTDLEKLEEIAEDIEEILATDNLTDAEKTALEDVLDQVEEMADIIGEVASDIKAATDAVDALKVATVTSDDMAETEQAIATIEELLAGDNLTDEEREALEETLEAAEALVEQVNAAYAAVSTESVDNTLKVTSENVKPTDEKALETAKADLEKALTAYAGNYTKEETEIIKGEIARIDKALTVIQNVEAVEETVGKLPATVEPDDDTTVAAIEAAQKAYDALSAYEKTLVAQTVKDKLDKLMAASVAYKIIKGDGSSWTQGGDGTLSITANGSYYKFVGLQVDGKDVDKANYDAKSGSTIITLKKSYLDTLAVGKHTITFVYTGGKTEGTFHIAAKAASPATGDNFNLMLWTGMLVVSTLAMAVLVMNRKRFMYKAKYVRK